MERPVHCLRNSAAEDLYLTTFFARSLKFTLTLPFGDFGDVWVVWPFSHYQNTHRVQYNFM